MNPNNLLRISVPTRLRSWAAPPLPKTDLFSIALRLKYGITYRFILSITPISPRRYMLTSESAPYGTYLGLSVGESISRNQQLTSSLLDLQTGCY